MIIFVGSKNPSKLLSTMKGFQEAYPDNLPYLIEVYGTAQHTDGSNTDDSSRVLTSLIKTIQPLPDEASEYHHIIGFEVDSNVSNQPMTAVETLTGARNRSNNVHHVVSQTIKMASSHDNKSSNEYQLCTSLFKTDDSSIWSTINTFYVGLEGGIESVDDIFLESGYIVIRNQDGKEGVGTSARFQISNHVMHRLQHEEGVELADIVDEFSSQSDVRSHQGMMGMITNGALSRIRAYTHGVLFALAPFISPVVWWD